MPSVKSKITVNGKSMDLYYIQTLAEALGRTSQTVRKWEVAGIIPKTIFKDKLGRRLYSVEQINIIVRTAEECKINQGKPISHTGFSKKIHAKLNAYAEQFVKGV